MGRWSGKVVLQRYDKAENADFWECRGKNSSRNKSFFFCIVNASTLQLFDFQRNQTFYLKKQISHYEGGRNSIRSYGATRKLENFERDIIFLKPAQKKQIIAYLSWQLAVN